MLFRSVRAYLERWEGKGYLRLRPENLKWSPFLVARTPKSEALGLLEEGKDAKGKGRVNGDGCHTRIEVKY